MKILFLHGWHSVVGGVKRTSQIGTPESESEPRCVSAVFSLPLGSKNMGRSTTWKDCFHKG